MSSILSLTKNYFKKILAFVVINIDIVLSFIEYVFCRKKFNYFPLKSGHQLEEIDKKNIAIYHIYTNNLEKDNKDYLNFLSKCGFHIIISSALKLKKSSIKYLEDSQLSYSLFFKSNVGRDFHSYKYFYEELEYRKIDYKNLLFCNDSLFFLKDLSSSLKEKIDNFFGDPSKTVASLTINYVAHAHLGSFFILVKRTETNSKKLTKYFNNYIPLSSRVWSIKYGECGLSDALRYPHEFQVSVFYNNSSLLKIDDLRSMVYASYLFSWIFKRNFNLTYQDLSFIKELDSKGLDSNLNLNQERVISQYLSILGEMDLETYNPTHALGLFYCLAGFPFLKKDILKVYAKVSNFHIITVLKLCNVKTSNINYIMEGLTARNYKISYNSRNFVNRIKNEVFL